MSQADNWKIEPQNAAIHEQALVWDNHGCLPFDDTEKWVSELRRYRESGVDVAVINIGDAQFPIETHIRMAAIIRRYVKEHAEDYVLALSVEDIEYAKANNKLAIGLDIEGAYAIGDQLSLVSFFYDIGVRWMAMVYNTKNLVGFGCHDTDDQGLTRFGYEVVAEMDRVGMVKCCSHTGYKTVQDVLEVSDVPSIFSHSCAIDLKNHQRNIPDHLIELCAAKGGVVGINGVGIFLGDNDNSVETLSRHIDHVVQLTSAAHVGLGLDYVFDQSGLDQMLADSPNIWPKDSGYQAGIKFFAPEDLPRLTERLLRMGYGETDIRSILGGNWLRIAKDVWK